MLEWLKKLRKKTETITVRLSPKEHRTDRRYKDFYQSLRELLIYFRSCRIDDETNCVHEYNSNKPKKLDGFYETARHRFSCELLEDLTEQYEPFEIEAPDDNSRGFINYSCYIDAQTPEPIENSIPFDYEVDEDGVETIRFRTTYKLDYSPIYFVSMLLAVNYSVDIDLSDNNHISDRFYTTAEEFIMGFAKNFELFADNLKNVLESDEAAVAYELCKDEEDEEDNDEAYEESAYDQDQKSEKELELFNRTLYTETEMSKLPIITLPEKMDMYKGTTPYFKHAGENKTKNKRPQAKTSGVNISKRGQGPEDNCAMA